MTEAAQHPGPVNWDKVRAEFPTLAKWTYLNTASFGLLPLRTRAAMESHYDHCVDEGNHDFVNWFDDMDGVRASVARLIRCQASDIAFIPNASYALSLLMANIQWDEGDEIITLEDEFPNNIYYPALLAQNGVTFRTVPWHRFFDSISPQTKMIVLSTVNYMSGFRPPLEELSNYLRERNILFYLDGTQSVGALDIDVTRLQPDMLAVHGYKWLLSPVGAGFLYVRPRFRRDLQPHVIGWRSDKRWREVQHLHHGPPELTNTAEKYEGGMIPFGALYGMKASIDMIQELGPAVIEARVISLAADLSQRLKELGGELNSDGSKGFHSPLVAVRFPGREAANLAAGLKERRILVAARRGNLRISTHFYNNEADLDHLITSLRALL